MDSAAPPPLAPPHPPTSPRFSSLLHMTQNFHESQLWPDLHPELSIVHSTGQRPWGGPETGGARWGRGLPNVCFQYAANHSLFFFCLV